MKKYFLFIAIFIATYSYSQSSWQLTGNSGTDETDNFIGTTDNQPLVLKANNTEAIRLAANGNLLFYTASNKDSKLTLQGAGINFKTETATGQSITFDAPVVPGINNGRNVVTFSHYNRQFNFSTSNHTGFGFYPHNGGTEITGGAYFFQRLKTDEYGTTITVNDYDVTPLSTANNKYFRFTTKGSFIINSPTNTANSPYTLDVNGVTRINQSNLLVTGNLNQFIQCGGDGSTNSALFGRYGNETILGSSGTTMPIFLQAFQVKIGASSPTTENSALLYLNSTAKGFLLSRLTTTQRNDIVNPANGLQIYNTTTNTIDYYNGTVWVSISNGITSNGTSNYLSKTTSSGTLGNSLLYDNGTNIGVGTTSPSEKLAVNGNIVSKKVRVTQTGWADYVFHPSYKLPPLAEVEAYIIKYQHLPEIPSAKEVEKNGLDLGDNQAALLKKIEELTLYVIEQNKRIEQLEKRVNE